MKIFFLFFIAFSLLLFNITIQQANAETFILEASSEQDRNDYLYIEFFLDGNIIETNDAFLRHDNYILVFDGTPANFYKSQSFSMKAPDLGIAIFAHPVSNLADLEYYFTVKIQGEDGSEKLNFYSRGITEEIPEPVIEEISRDPLAEYEASQVLTGPALVSETERLEALAEEQRLQEEWNNRIIIPREDYTVSDKEIAIMIQAPFSVPTKSNYNFDIRVVDPVVNDLHNYYDTTGIISDVSITGSIKDSLGNILNSFSGNTTDQGHYSNSAYIPENINTRDSFSLELFATKYFDENASFATYSILEEFFVFVPSDGGTKPSCNAGDLMAPNGTCVAECPVGTELDDDWMCRLV